MSDRPNRVVIVGRDAALWLSAAVLRQALGAAGVTVTAVELPTRFGAASAYASLPPLEAFHARLGIDEAALLRTTNGSFSLGYNIVGPGEAPPPFFLAHGAYGTPIGGSAFFGYWLKARQFGLNAALEDFSPTAMAARQGRMLLPDEATETFGRTDYAYTLPAIPYVAMLKTRAARFGVAIHQAREIGVGRDPHGAITAIRLDTGEIVGGDLFVDASGPEGLLSGTEIDDWRAFFPADRRLTARGNRFAPVPPYSELRLDRAGSITLHASQGATQVVHAYATDDQGDDAALARAAALAGMALFDPIVTSIRPGRRAAAWSGNCVAIGAAACDFDPAFDAELHAIQLGLVHLLGLFPVGSAFAAERDEYNRIMRSTFERVRDFQAAFYALTRPDVATMPATLAHKIAAFLVRGDIAPMEDESFAPDQWQALFVGLGAVPEGWPPAIDRTPPDRIKDEFRRMLGFIKTKVLEQPTHDDYLTTLARSAAA